jgi:hypothetical protein
LVASLPQEPSRTPIAGAERALIVVSDDARSIPVDTASVISRQARGRLCTLYTNAFRSRKIRTSAILPAASSLNRIAEDNV